MMKDIFTFNLDKIINDQEELEKLVQEYGFLDDNDDIEWMLSQKNKTNMELKLDRKRFTKIYYVSNDLYKKKFIDLIKNVSLLTDIEMKDVTPEYLNRKLLWDEKIPDPDVGVIFGGAMCVYDFPCYHLSNTELL